jgi:hypothetical protein
MLPEWGGVRLRAHTLCDGGLAVATLLLPRPR